MKVIFKDLAPWAFYHGSDAARWILERPKQKDAILVYGPVDSELALCVRRNKSSITVRMCG